MAPLTRAERRAGVAWFAALGMAAVALVSLELHALDAPFLMDDYIFLDKGRTSSFGELWGFERLTLGWYRPWSRELHFWALGRAFGDRPLAFHLASFALFLGSIAAYFGLARRVTGDRAALVATAGVLALAGWAVTLFWIAGAQDLWMIVLGLGSVLAFARGAPALAAGALALALLSKETAVVWPAVAFAYAWIVERRTMRSALARVVPMLAVVVAWALIHPALGGRLWRAAPPPNVAGIHPPLAELAFRSLGSVVNLDAPLAPERGWTAAILRALPLIAASALAILWIARRSRPAGEEKDAATPRRAALFGLSWAVAGWAPLLLPRLGWHGYYALVGAMGAWLALAVGLAARPALGIGVVAGALVLRSAQVDTPSQDWGTESYQRRAADFMRYMRQDLQRLHPGFPPHTRLYFAAIPSHVGFLTDDGPALRSWYRDPTLRAGFYRDYAARRSGEPAGADLFFRYDSAAGFVEVRKGPEDAEAARAANPRWEEDHRELAAVLAAANEWRAAAVEREKLAAARPGDPDLALDAGVSREMAGDTAAAAAWYRRAASLPGASDEARRFAERFPQHVRSRP